MTRISFLLIVVLSGLAFTGCFDPNDTDTDTNTDDTSIFDKDKVEVTFVVTTPNLIGWGIDPPYSDGLVLNVDRCIGSEEEQLFPGICDTTNTLHYDGGEVTTTIKADLDREQDHYIELFGGGVACSEQTFHSDGAQDETYQVTWDKGECRFLSNEGWYADEYGWEEELYFNWEDTDNDKKKEALVYFAGFWQNLLVNTADLPSIGSSLSLEGSLQDIIYGGELEMHFTGDPGDR